MRALAWAVGLSLALLTALAAGFFVKESFQARAARLAVQNRVLGAEVDELTGRLAVLESAVDELTAYEMRYRLLAGLDPLLPAADPAGEEGSDAAPASTSPATGVQFASAAVGSAELDALVARAQQLASTWQRAVPSLSGADRITAVPSIVPTLGYLSKQFTRNGRHPALHVPRPHEGIDISAPAGSPVLAAAEGRVQYVGRRGDFGLVVELDHGNGYTTRYAHLGSALVRIGQTVERGARIAVVGETGLALGPHVHYEVLLNGRPHDPRTYILNNYPLPD